MTKFSEARVDVDVDHMEHYRTGDIPNHQTIYYEPKVVKCGRTNYMVQFRYCADSNRFRWKIFRRPMIRNRSTRHTVDMTGVKINLDEPVSVGFEDGERVWTTKMCLMDDVLSFFRWYDVDKSGKIYAAVPGRIPIMNFGRQGLPYPPMKG